MVTLKSLSIDENINVKDSAGETQKEVRSIIEKNRYSAVWGKGRVPVSPFQLDKERPRLLSLL